MASKEQERQARALLDRLIELDHQTVEAYYDMGSIISSMQHGELYKLIGYSSMRELIDEELSYTPSTGYKYAIMYRRFRQLKYTKIEAMKLLKKYGISHVYQVLREIKDKIGDRAFGNRVKAIDVHIIGFQLTGEQLALAHEVLKKFGAMKKNERWEHTSEAFIAILEQATGNNARKPKLVAVK